MSEKLRGRYLNKEVLKAKQVLLEKLEGVDIFVPERPLYCEQEESKNLSEEVGGKGNSLLVSWVWKLLTLLPVAESPTKFICT